MKKNKVIYEAAIKQMDLLLPEDLAEPYKYAMTVCKDTGNLNSCFITETIITALFFSCWY